VHVTNSMRPFLFLVLLTLAGALPVRLAAETGFIPTLTTEQQLSTGLTRLSADQQTALNALVAREVSLAHQGNVRAFAGTFVSRRKPAELKAAGLDRLTAEEQDRLNDLVALAIAAGPVKPEPRELKPGDVSVTDRLQIHGSIGLAMGWGGGRSFRAGSFFTDIYDPVTGLELGIGLSAMSGNGWMGWDGYPGYYDPAFNRFDLSTDSPWLTDRNATWTDDRNPWTETRGGWIRRH